MVVQIDCIKDALDVVAHKIREEYGFDVVAIQGGEPGKQHCGHDRGSSITFRELVGTVEFGKFYLMMEHVQQRKRQTS